MKLIWSRFIRFKASGKRFVRALFVKKLFFLVVAQTVLFSPLARAAGCCAIVGDSGLCEDGTVPVCDGFHYGQCGKQVIDYLRSMIYKKGSRQMPFGYGPDEPLPQGFNFEDGSMIVYTPPYDSGELNLSNTDSYGVRFKFSDNSGKDQVGEALLCARLNGDCRVADQPISFVTIKDTYSVGAAGKIPCGLDSDPFGEFKKH